MLKALGLTEDKKKLPRAEALKRAQGKAPLPLPHSAGDGVRVTRCSASLPSARFLLASHHLSTPNLHLKIPVT